MQKNIKITINALVYIISMTFAFTTKYGDILLDHIPRTIIGMCWIIFALLQLGINKFSIKGDNAKNLSFFMKLYLTPHIVIHLYTIVLMALGVVSWSYFTTNVTVYVPVLMALLALYLFKEKALYYTTIALIASWILSVTVSTILKGPMIFPHAIIQAYINPNDQSYGLTSNYLELHDLVLAVGYFVIYYVFSRLRLTKKNFIILSIVIIIMGLGMKRVSILGLIIALIFNFFASKLSDSRRYKFCLVVGWLAFFACYLYIYVLSQGDVLFEVLSKYGINPMGRNYYYKAIMQYASFSPSFLGIGRNVVTHLFTNELAYLKVGGVHSDLIKMFVENGFILYGLWLWYYLIFLTRKYKQRFGVKASFLYFGLVIYTFSLYSTDNIEIYFICQIFSILIPCSYAIYGKEKLYAEKFNKKNRIS